MCRGDYRVLLHFRTTNLILLPFHIFADYISCISKAYVVYVEQQPTSSETSWIRIPFAPIFGGPPTKSPGDTACQVGKGPIDMVARVGSLTIRWIITGVAASVLSHLLVMFIVLVTADTTVSVGTFSSRGRNYGSFIFITIAPTILSLPPPLLA